jgi:hypothetical protein
MPKTKGLIIMPSKSPNLIQSMLRNKSKSAFNIVIMKKIAEIVPNIYAKFKDLFAKKYPVIIMNTKVKKYPNFLLEGISISEYFALKSFII